MLQKTHIRSLAQRFPAGQFTVEPAEMLTYEVDAGFDRAMPDGVFYPSSTADVERMVQWAAEAGVPLVARGAGTGLAGGAVAEAGGIVLEFARMNALSPMDPVGRSLTVGSGVVNQTLDGLAREHGFYFPPDPSSGRSSTLGGNIGTNAGGPHCFKYGVTTNYVIGVEVVLADGRAVQMGGRALDYPEYDLCALMVGSEGTLGAITAAHVRLMRNPPGVQTLMVAFDSEAAACTAVSAVIAAGLLPATMEMMDQRSMRMVHEFMGADIGLPAHAGAALIVDVDGYVAGLDAQIEEVAEIFANHGGYDIRIAQSEEERARIWYGRKSAAGAFSRLSPNYYLTDVTVPRSQLGEIMADINAICREHDVITCNFFHAGDGNLHPLILCDVRDHELMERVHSAAKEIISLCIARDGSITGEHGVGMEKRQYMTAMYSAAELSAMHDIKTVFDPQHLFNPGKVLPAELPAPERVAPQMPAPGTITPTSAAEAAAALRALGESGESVRIGGAEQGAPHPADRWLSTSGLRDIIDFAPDDLRVTVGAGMRLSELHAFLRERNVQVPMLSPWDEGTVGGLLSANVNGPLRGRYGALRDTLLCATVALADGRVIRAGRPVVKNVAGYDLPKLFVGAHGTLGLLTDATLKLTPLPRARRSLAISAPDVAQGMAWAAALVPHLLAASGLVLCTDTGTNGAAAPVQLIYTAEGLAEDVASEMAEVVETLHGLGAAAHPFPDEGEAGHQTPGGAASAHWSAFVAQTGADEMLVRIGIPAMHGAAYWQMIDPQVRTQAAWCIDPANGLLYARLPVADAHAAVRQLAALREPALSLRGYAILMQPPGAFPGTETAPQLDPWGYRPDAIQIMRALKARWDPYGVLNPGVFPA